MVIFEEDGVRFNIWLIYFGGDGLESICCSCKRDKNGFIY